jgi:elongation factor G
MFGAIDGSKFIGKLKRIPILRDKIRKQYIYFTVDLTSVTVVSPTDVLRINREDDPIKVFLDSSSTVSYLPQDVSERIWNEVGVVYFRKYNAPMIECENANSTGGIRFKLGLGEGQLITVPMSELVLLPGLVPKAEDLVGEAGEWRGRNLCQFGIRNSSANANILGDSFLRSAYVVYDLVNHEVGIAQARMEATEPAEVIPFPTFGARIPELERGLDD